MKPAMIASVIGRDAELQAIVDSWRAAEPGVVVTATPGMGRTTLCAAAVAEIRNRGGDVLELRPTASGRQVSLGVLAPALLGDTSTDDLLEHVQRALHRRTSRRRLAIVIDDAHDLDALSMTVLIELVDGAAAHGDAFLLASCPDGTRSPLTDHAELARLRLPSLSDAELEAVLVEHGHDPAEAMAAVGRMAGNPGAVLRRLTGARPDTLAMAPAVSGATLDLVETLAVAGTLAVDVLEALGHGPALAPATAAGLVRIFRATTPVARLGDPDLAGTVRDALPTLRFRSLLRTVLAVTEPSVRSSDLVAVALAAGVPMSVGDLRVAADRARATGDGTALSLARAAARASDDTADGERWLRAALTYGDDKDVDEATDATDAATSPIGRFALAQRNLWRGDGPAAALEVIAVPGTALDVATRTLVLAVSGRAAAAQRLTSGDDDELAVELVTAAHAHALRQLGRPDDALRLLDDAHVSRADAPTSDVTPMIRTLCLLDVGSWYDAEEVALAELRAARRAGSPPRTARAAIVLAAVATERGDILGASRQARLAAQALAGTDRAIERNWAIEVSALAAALGGDIDLARTELDRRTLPTARVTTLAGIGHRAGAWAEADTITTCERLHRAARELLEDGDVGAAATCLHDLAVVGDAGTAARLLDTIPSATVGLLGALRVDHVRALAAHDHERLSELGVRFAALGGGRLAVECVAEAASTAARRGNRRAARRAAAAARELAEACPGLATARLREASALLAGMTAPITRRERDVALRAAAGRSNRDIAEDLTMSERTVEGHLARCYDKLGAHTRADLARVLSVGPST